MFRHKPFLRFTLRFVLAFALLALPWPHWREGWISAVQNVAEWTFGRSDSSREVSVAVLQPPVHGADIRFTITNPGLLNPDGSGPVRSFDFSAGQLAMRPAALLAALLFATPMPWRRRIWCLLGGTALLQVAILSVLAFCLWRESMELLLVSTSEETKSVATAVQDGLAQYSGLVFPVAIWLLLCVRPGGSPRAPSPFSTPVSNTVTSAPAVAKQT